ncbi:AMP-binding protein [Treponema bryantii]|uniref:AMP-binding protein n=1 Tax=Treponema bryantii TaxID=163 RepID=UPI0003B6AC34|nr:AMP-binding protein [Treponema bryantii]
MKKFLKALFYVIAAIYPILVFTLLVVLKVETKILSLCIVALAAAFFLSATGSKKTSNKKSALDWKPILSSLLFLAAGLFCFFTGKEFFLKLYSVVINATLLVVFGSTLFLEPNIIFRFATLADKSIAGSSYENQVKLYCKKVTIVWCCFFILNGSAAALTTFADKLFGLSPDQARKVWAVYNSGISYVLMGTLFLVEFIIRKLVDAKMIKAYPITKFNADSRKDDYVMCYEDTWTGSKEGGYKTWKDFLIDSAKMRRFIEATGADEFILHCEDYWYFLCTFVALLQCQKAAYLTQNISENFMADVRKPGMAFLTDQKTEIADAVSIQKVIEEAAQPDQAEYRTTPAIDGEKTRIFLFTSGSTGKPKAVPQRMKEFEEDNAFIISKWGQEFTERKLITTVSQHHIYGFLFGISLPFTLGTPFRRHRVEFPEEFEKLTDVSYILIATPAFLKRTVEVEEKLDMKKVWIFTSGGAVSPELALQTEKVFGFCPLEVYGSTETSGIAYRQQNKDKLVWTPFDNAKIWLGDDGCIRIISPYIKNPEGFATADLAEIYEDGRFILKGRSDSIVKIEEKRISMTEVEARLMESGLVEDVKVVALSNDVRQYLAAAVVLNAKGREQFKDTEKFMINRWFHDFLMKYFENVVIPKKWRFMDKLPTDVQGKKHKLEIEALFTTVVE